MIHSEHTTIAGTPNTPQHRSLSGRALVLSLCSVIAFTVVGNISVFHRYEIIGTGYLPRGVVFFLLLLLVWNAVMGRCSSKLRLKRSELLITLCVLVSMASIPAQDFAQHFYLDLVGLVRYSQTPGPALQLNLLQHTPDYLLPSTDPESPVIDWVYTGAPSGESIPYRAWVRPLLVWTPYIFSLYWFLLWVAGLLAPHWEEHERLLFPLMRVAFDVVESPRIGARPLLSTPSLWITFTLISLLYLLIGLRAYFPLLPEIRISTRTGILFSTGPARTFNNMRIDFRPEMIGISYLLTSEVAFSLWFFFFFRHFIIMVRTMLGVITPHRTFLESQALGGYLVLAAALVYNARQHLQRAWRSARGATPEGAFYRTCFVGITSGLVVLLTWCHIVGVSFVWAVTQYALFTVASLVASRIICEAGMFLYSSPLFGLSHVMFSNLGRYMGPKNITLLTMISWTDIRNSSAMAMPFMMQGYRVGTEAGISRRQAAALMMVAVALSVIACHVTVPWVAYSSGLGKMQAWIQGTGGNTVNRLAGFINRSARLTPGTCFAIASGGVIAAFLSWMRLRVLAWPFHPLGFVAALWGWPIDRYWFSILLGWLWKVAVLHFGGYEAYRRGRPVAYGLVLGLSFMLTAWMLLHYIWPAANLIMD